MAAPAPPARKRLMRSVSDKKIAGVCGGLADFFGMDATVIRILWLLAVFLGGTGVLAYVICWIAMPEAPAGYVSPSGVTAS